MLPRAIAIFFIIFTQISAYADTAIDMSDAINTVRVECGNVATQLNDMKRRAGINTAVTSVGTATGAGAMGTGIARSAQVDKMSDIDDQIAELESARDVAVAQNAAARDARNAWMATHGASWNAIASKYASLMGINPVPTYPEVDDINVQEIEDKISSLKSARAQMSGQAAKLGNARTGLAAATTTTNVVGAVVASKNQGDGNLSDAIRSCSNAVKVLQNIQTQSRLDGTATDIQLDSASKIITACRDVDLIDTSKITKRAKGAMGASIVGAITGGVATITSGVAVSRNDATDKKTRDLDTSSNVFSGAAGASSLTATVFNATQISAIKKASQIIDKCQEVLE